MIDEQKVHLRISLPGKRACFWGAPAHAVTAGSLPTKKRAWRPSVMREDGENVQAEPPRGLRRRGEARDSLNKTPRGRS